MSRIQALLPALAQGEKMAKVPMQPAMVAQRKTPHLVIPRSWVQAILPPLLLGDKTGWIKFLNMAISSSKVVKHYINIKRSRVLTPLLPLWKCQIIFLNMANSSSTVVELSPYHPKVKGSSSATCPGTSRKNGESSKASAVAAQRNSPHSLIPRSRVQALLPLLPEGDKQSFKAISSLILDLLSQSFLWP